MPRAPRIEDVEAMTRRGMWMCAVVEWRMCEAGLLVSVSVSVEMLWRDVKVPGNITKPARRIH